MKGVRETVFLCVVVIEVLFFLLPTTVLFVFGMSISIAGFFGANRGVFTPVFLYIAGLLLLPGYSLYSLWWLIVKYKNLTLDTIPKRIWVGLIMGIALALWVNLPIRLEPPEFISMSDYLHNKVDYGLGPVVVAMTVIFIIYFKNRSNNNLHSESFRSATRSDEA